MTQYTEKEKAKDMIEALAGTYFDRKEFACKCCGNYFMDDELVRSLTNLRILFAKPMILTSAYRCEHHNRAVNGSINSLHKKGLAVDVCTSSYNASDKLLLIRLSQVSLENTLSLKRFNGLGIAKDFIHLDIRDEMSTWVY